MESTTVAGDCPKCGEPDDHMYPALEGEDKGCCRMCCAMCTCQVCGAAASDCETFGCGVDPNEEENE